MKLLPTSPNDWITKKSESVYENNWIEVKHNDVITPGGEKGVYGEVHFKNIAIGIIAFDKNGLLTLVGQFRYPHKSYSWEIPAGGCPISEIPLEAAKRELKEETGMVSGTWKKVIDMHLSNSVSDEECQLFLATECELVGEPEPEQTENLKHYKCNTDELVQRIEQGEINDSLTVCAGLWLKANGY